eukprot:jgi/Tetstr1/457607/TSEL_044174.t1
MASEGGAGWALGLTVCTTGLSSGQRRELASAVAAAGGSYAPALSRACTHLLLGEAVANGRVTSEKLSHGLRVGHRWGLAVAELSWWEASCAAGRPLPTAPFAPPPEVSSAGAVVKPSKASSRQIDSKKLDAVIRVFYKGSGHSPWQ